MVRLLGMVVLFFGAAMLYYTYSNAASGIAPEIITTNYALGFLLSVVGVLAVFAKFK